MGRLCRDITVILRHGAQITKIAGPLRSADAHRLHALRNTALTWAIDRLRRAPRTPFSPTYAFALRRPVEDSAALIRS